MNKNKVGYFIYSKTQYDDKTTIEKTRSKVYKPGRVYTNTGYKDYTELCDKDSNRYSDGVVVAYGVLNKMKYTEAN